MNFNNILLWFTGMLFSCSGVFSLNILAVLPYPGRSHFFVFEPYLHELARRGHNLTVISYFPQKIPMENYHDISLAGKVEIIENIMPLHRSYWDVLHIILFLFGAGTENCKIMLADEIVQKLWKSKPQFDVVVVERFNSDCALGLAHQFGAPTVGLTSHMLLPWHYEQVGMQYNPSHVPFILLEGGTKPSLFQRIERSLFHLFAINMYKLMCVRENQNELQRYFDNTPPLPELARGVKFTLLYTNFMLTGAHVYPPSVKEVGGYHVAKPKELPQELKTFIEESKHGVIYISFGSMLKPELTPPDKVEAIVAAVSQLPQRVIWKWNTKLPRKPTNVYLSKWLPQNDILAHPNVLAFYSHCGMLGTTEAIYHGVPMIGMPVFGDQPGNAAAVEESGLGVQIQIKELTKENLLQKFKTVLDPEFRRKVKELSKAWHDTPLTPMDSAIYWTEFAARTKNFTFKSPGATVALYQYLCLDLLAVAAIFVLSVIFAFKLLFRLLLGSKPKDGRQNKTKTK